MVLGWFLLTQVIYNTGFFALTFSIFRLKHERYFWWILAFGVVNALIAFCLHWQLAGYVVQLIGVLFTMVFLFFIVKIPAIWSFILTASGNVATFVIQTVFMLACGNFFLPLSLKHHEWRNYVLDVASGIIFYAIAVFLYRKGIGFTYDFEKIRMRRERYIVLIISVVSVLTFPLLITFNSDVTLDLGIGVAIFVIELVFFIVYSIRKEKQFIEFDDEEDVEFD